MDGGLQGEESRVHEAPPVAALLRRPAMAVRHEVMRALRAAGFVDVLPAHLGVFQYPGPDGLRPGVLAARNHASKQAMNHLLHQLEGAGYLVRETHPHDRRTRVVRLTAQGWEVLRVIQDRILDLESRWVRALGEETHAALQAALFRLEGVLDETLVG